jgi:hypothetical protein
MKNLVMALIVVTAALTACGKKGGGSGGSAPGVAAGACALDAFGRCVGGAGIPGVVPANTWTGNISVTDPNRYRQFLVDNGLCYGMSCHGMAGFFSLVVQTIRDSNVGPSNYASLPGWVNFAIRPSSTGWYQMRGLNTRGEGRITNSNNGFEVIYSPSQYWGGPMPMPYGQPYGYPYQQPQPQVNRTLQIVVTWADATQTIANATVLYQGVQFAYGRVTARFFGGPNMVNGPQQPYPYYQNRQQQQIW